MKIMFKIVFCGEVRFITIFIGKNLLKFAEFVKSL